VGRFTAQVPPKFREALADFRLRWADACALKTVVALSIEELFDAIEVVEPLDSDADLEKASAFAGNWLGKLLDSLPCLPMAEERSDDATEPRPFDPSRDSVDEAIWWLVDIFGKDPLFVENFGYSADEPLTWINETVGLNLGEIERRWLEFPVIVVPQHVSDRYGLDEPHGLYGLLTQVRLAYMSGANLAAIALCRSVTELLIRYHYASDIPNATISKGKGRTGLEWLIQQVQQRKEFESLRRFNLIAKIDDANNILHQAATDIVHREHTRGLVMEWVSVLVEMINQAPRGGAGIVAA
jgi:hypothetical protein